jgi:hypothetical protein
LISASARASTDVRPNPCRKPFAGFGIAVTIWV